MGYLNWLACWEYANYNVGYRQQMVRDVSSSHFVSGAAQAIKSIGTLPYY